MEECLLLLSKVVDRFLSKLADYALGDEHTSVFKSLDNHLKLLRARASDYVEEIKKAELLGTKKRKKEVVYWSEQVESTANEVGTLTNDMQTRGFVMKFFSEGRAAKLDARVLELVEQSPVSGELIVDDHEVKGDVFLTEGLVGDGFKENLEEIWTLLVTEKIKCIGIHGMGGVGKTTLAKHINNRLVEENQYHVVWITVSEQYSVTKLQDEITKDLHIDISDLHDEDRRSSRLNQGLSKLNNVVLIFDDVWERINLMKMGHPLSIEGCRLVITTRSQQVCRQIGCNKIIDVKRLQESEGWVLFKQTHGPELSLTPEVERIAKSTVEKCKGLPLGIITLAGSMRGETSSHAWSDVLAQLNESVMGQYDMVEDVFKVLKLSFDRLALRDGKRNGYSKSQLCFLYCSTYPEDYSIDREELIRSFIVEDYLDRKESRESLFNEGRTILDNLVYACLLERGHNDRVKVHDLLRALALKITEDITKVFDGRKSSWKDIPNAKLWTEDVEKLFLWDVSGEDFSEMMPPNCPKLSTLSFNRWLPLSNSFFSQMHGLSTLHISGSSIEVLPNSLSDVVNLKALICAYCVRLKYVPNLGKLKKLEELDLSCTRIEEVPQGMEELINLKFLSFCATLKMKGTRLLLLNFTNIQCLLLPPLIELQGEVVELEHLEQFHGWLKDVSHFRELIRKRPKLRYRIRVSQDLMRFGWKTPWRGRNQLELCEYELKKVGDEDAAVFRKANIVHLRLRECEWRSKCIIEDVSRMCDPTSLESLEVMGGKEEIVDRGGDVSLSTTAPLPHLVFSSLKELEISDCPKVKRLGLIPSQFPILEALSIKECSEIEEIMEVGDQEHGIHNLVFPNLERLYLINLPRLKSICNATMVCPSISAIHLRGCRQLKKLPLIFGQFNHSPPPNHLHVFLRRGEEEWWEALELPHPTHRHLLKPAFI